MVENPPDGSSVLSFSCPACLGPVKVVTNGYPPDPATHLALAHDGDGEFSVVVYSADGTSLTIHQTGPYRDTVSFQSPEIISVIADGVWAISGS